MKNRWHQFISLCYVLIDAAVLWAAFFIPMAHYQHASVHYERYVSIYAFWIVATVFFCRSLNLYSTDRYTTAWQETRRVLRSVTFSTFLTMALLVFFKLHFVSRAVMAANYALAVAGLMVWRFLKRQLVQYLVSRGFNNSNVLIVGAGKMGRQYAIKLMDNPQLGLRVIGFLDNEHASEPDILGIPVLGAFKDLSNVVHRHFIEQLLVTTYTPREEITALLAESKELNLTLQMVPDYFSAEELTINVKQIDDIPVIEYRALTPNYQMIIFKRVLDLLMVLPALVVLSPLFLLISALIKLDSPGPVFYVSKRWGLKGRLFDCYKFRSMVTDADLRKKDLQHQNEADGPVFKMRNDPRLTRVGKILRRYSLDELPQLLNILKGDMSIVGPRPLPQNEEVGSYKVDYLRRLRIKPGLTCLWQVRGRSNIPFTHWMRWDTFYMKHWSPLLDLRIILWTVPAVLKGRGAY